MTRRTNFGKKQPLILVADDDRTMCMIIRVAMENEGYRVAETNDGKKCFDLSQQLKPDIILLDAMIPEMDGFTCCKKLHSILGDHCPPILMITSLDDGGSVDLAFSAGAADYVTKPIHWPVLFQRVKRILETRWAMKELKRQFSRERELTEKLELVNQELQRLATTDSLTQIANRGTFDRYLDREWRRMGREQKPLSLILCDVDFFKRYNDTYGHQGGDECLKQIAKVLSQNARRAADLAARYGGEEFAVILPNTEAKGAVTVAEIMRAKVKALQLPHAASEVSEFVSLSLGVSSVIPQRKSSMESLIAKADEALYQAKEQGRDRVVFNELVN